MENKKVDLRVIKTKQLIKSCFMELMQEKCFSKITVTELTKKAKINRNTFYLHYLDLEDLMDNIISDEFKDNDFVIKSIIRNRLMSQHNKENISELILYDLFDYFLEKFKSFKVLMTDPDLSIYLNKLKYKIKDIVKNDNLSSDQSFIFDFIFEGLFGVVVEWIKTEYATKEQISKELTNLFSNYLSSVIDEQSFMKLILKN